VKAVQSDECGEVYGGDDDDGRDEQVWVKSED